MKPGKMGKMGEKHDGPPSSDQKGKKDGNKRDNGQTGDPRHGPPGMANLTESERGQLKALHEQVKSDSAVSAAREAVQNAATPEARRSAEEAAKQVVHDAMIKIDPSIEPILEKLRAGSEKPTPDATPAMQ